MASFSTAGPTVNSGSTTTTLAPIPIEPESDLYAALEAPFASTVLFADYWVARPMRCLRRKQHPRRGHLLRREIALPSIQAAEVPARTRRGCSWTAIPPMGTFKALQLEK